MGVLIRLATPDDTAAVAEIYAPIVQGTFISFETTPPSMTEMRSRIVAAQKAAPWLVCEIDGVVAGYAYASKWRERPAYRWAVETTVYIRDGYRGRGVGKALCSSLLECLKLQGYKHAFAVIALPNPASVALAESLGGRHIGVQERVGFKDGEWVGVGTWQIALGELEPSPREPVAPAELLGTEAWETAVASGAGFVREGAG